MVDSHCHLTDERLSRQLDAVIARAAAPGVSRLITIGTDLDDDAEAIALCTGRDNVRCAIGIHPNYSADAAVADVEKIRQLQSDPSVVALGEMGLDYHYEFADRAHQADIFEAQLQLATGLRQPVVIHCRDAVDDTLAILKKFPSVRAVFHCFTGTVEEARRILDHGYLLGFTGVVTFKTNDALRQVVALCPLDRLLVETDAPYLSPEPMRKQKVNEPALIVHTFQRIAQIKGVAPEELERRIDANVDSFFRWP